MKTFLLSVIICVFLVSCEKEELSESSRIAELSSIDIVKSKEWINVSIYGVSGIAILNDSVCTATNYNISKYKAGEYVPEEYYYRTYKLTNDSFIYSNNLIKITNSPFYAKNSKDGATFKYTYKVYSDSLILYHGIDKATYYPRN